MPNTTHETGAPLSAADAELLKAEATKEVSRNEQLSLIKEEIQRFIKLAKDKGHLTIEEINEQLPAEIVDASALDSFMQALEVNGVI
ncbi:MAG: hypothetical protein EOP10_29905, partial [Proteobacteria bacterium]